MPWKFTERTVERWQSPACNSAELGQPLLPSSQKKAKLWSQIQASPFLSYITSGKLLDFSSFTFQMGIMKE